MSDLMDLKNTLFVAKQIVDKLEAIYTIELSNKNKPSDIVNSFVVKCCLLDTDNKIKASDLYQALQHYCSDNNLECPSINRLSRDLKQFGCRNHVIEQQRGYIGIKLAD